MVASSFLRPSNQIFQAQMDHLGLGNCARDRPSHSLPKEVENFRFPEPEKAAKSKQKPGGSGACKLPWQLA